MSISIREPTNAFIVQQREHKKGTLYKKESENDIDHNKGTFT